MVARVYPLFVVAGGADPGSDGLNAAVYNGTIPPLTVVVWIGENTIWPTVISVGTVILVIAVIPKVAMSVALLGTVAGVQFAGLVHLLSTGLAFQVALPARQNEPMPKRSEMRQSKRK